MMEWIYWSISWILLRWHQVWDFLLPGGGTFLGTTWDWILAIIFLVITVRIILFPIFVKQIRSQRGMQALQPKVKELQTKYKGDQQTLREEMMKLYQTEKVNPLMGCLPMLLQIPVFLGLFHVLQRLDPVQKVNTTIYGWTQVEWDSAARARLFNAPIAGRFADNATQLNILGATGTTVKIVAGILVLVMMFSTFMTSRQMILKTGWNPDPQQRMIQKIMLYGIPFSLLLSGWYFPIGVIVYWVTQNIFSFGQQYWVLHKYPPPLTAGAVPASTKNIFARIPVAGATSIPPKSAPPERPVPKAKAPQGGGFVNPVQDDKKGGLFRRKPEPTVPVVETRSLGPKPGAKPKVAQPNGVQATGAPQNGTQDAGAQANGSKSGTSGQNGASSSTTAVPKPAAGAKPTPGAKPAPAAKPGATSPAQSRVTQSGSGQTSTPKPGPKPATGKSGGKPTPKKGQPSKKGGPRR